MIQVNFPTGIDEITVPALNQWDYGQKLNIYGVHLPQETEVHFCDKTCEKAIVRLASKVYGVGTNPDYWEVFIPDVLIENKWDIHAYIFLHSYEEACGVTAESVGTYYTRSGSEGSYVYTEVTLPDEYSAGTTYYRLCGKVTKKIIIPVIPRIQPDTTTPDEAEVQSFLDAALARIDEAAEHVESQADNATKIYNIKDAELYDAWIGTDTEYEALTPAEKARDNTIHIYDNHLKEKLLDGSVQVAEAVHADNATNAENADNASRVLFESETGVVATSENPIILSRAPNKDKILNVVWGYAVSQYETVKVNTAVNYALFEYTGFFKASKPSTTDLEVTTLSLATGGYEDRISSSKYKTFSTEGAMTWTDVYIYKIVEIG